MENFICNFDIYFCNNGKVYLVVIVIYGSFFVIMLNFICNGYKYFLL